MDDEQLWLQHFLKQSEKICTIQFTDENKIPLFYLSENQGPAPRPRLVKKIIELIRTAIEEEIKESEDIQCQR